VNIIFFYILG